MGNSKLAESASVAVNQCLRVQKGESCLVITDKPCRSIGMAIFEVAKAAGAEAIMLDMISRAVDGEEPPAVVTAAMLNADVVIAPTYRSISHTDARRNASSRGVRIATLPGIVEETMMRAMSADYGRIAELSTTLADMLTAGKQARLVTARGTDISFGLDGREGHADTGILHNEGDFGNLPAGEAYIAPVEKTSNGILVVDGSMGDSGVLSKETISLKVVNGYAEEIFGGNAAADINEVVEPYGREARNVAELGIGTNDKAAVIGNILEDEKVFGTVHVAIGNNKSMGGIVDVGVHLDGIILEPTLTIDDREILVKGKLVI